MAAGWIIDPVTREPMPAFEPSDSSLRPLCGNHEWLGEHDPSQPSWELSTVDDCGFQYVRKCQRPCVHLPARWPR